MSDLHEVYAVRYAHHDRKAHENYIGGDPHDILQPLAYFVWVDHGRRTAPSSWTPASTRRWPPSAAAIIVRPVGRGPDGDRRRARRRCTDVIISHLHYDHCGNHDLFPRARYHLQDREMAYAHRPLHVPRAPAHPVRSATTWWRWCGRCSTAAWCFTTATSSWRPGLTVHHIGGHSKGLQCVRVKTRRGHVVLAADATHLYAHVNEGRVFPITYSVAETLEGYATLKRLADSPDHIIPGHDADVLERYPAAGAGSKDWIVDLD